MAIFKPFRGLRYNVQSLGVPLSDLICPPYDVIDGAMQQALYDKSNFNVVRVELTKTEPSDAPGNDRYSRAAATLAGWIKKEALKQDSQPAFYLYEQTFDIASGGASRSKVVKRRGVFGAIRLEPFGTGSVFPHEETFGGPKADRLNLMRACEANLSPTFGLIPDPDNAMTSLLEKGVALKGPDAEVVEANGVVNRLWFISDPQWCRDLSERLKDRKVYIADGHHRYETCCNYRDERRKADHDPDGKLDKDYNYGLMVCVPMSDAGLYILPTHRLIQKAPGLSKDSFLADAAAFFDIQPAADKDLLRVSEEESGPVKFGVVFSDGTRKLLAAKPLVAEAMRQQAPGKSEAWRKLDVSVLQTVVLKSLLKLSEEKVLRKEGLSYTPDMQQAIARVTAADTGYVMGFILRPTLIQQVVDMQGAKMPQKSTYFYPKLLTGMVIRRL